MLLRNTYNNKKYFYIIDWIFINPVVFKVCCSSDGSRLVNKDACTGVCSSWQQSCTWAFPQKSVWTTGCAWDTPGCWQGRLFSQVFLFLEEITFHCSAARILYSLLFPAVYMSVSSKILHLPYGAISFIYLFIYFLAWSRISAFFSCLPSQTLFCYWFLKTPGSTELECYCSLLPDFMDVVLSLKCVI